MQGGSTFLSASLIPLKEPFMFVNSSHSERIFCAFFESFSFVNFNLRILELFSPDITAVKEWKFWSFLRWFAIFKNFLKTLHLFFFGML